MQMAVKPNYSWPLALLKEVEMSEVGKIIFYRAIPE